MYRASETQSVLDRLTGLATAVRVVCAIVFAVLCGAIGAVVGASVGFAAGHSQDAAAGGFANGGFLGLWAGVPIGLLIAHFLVVWIEWARQVLAALHTLVPSVEPVPIPVSAPPASVPITQPPIVVAEWCCSDCGYINNASAERCGRCRRVPNPVF